MTYLRLFIVYARDAIEQQQIEQDLCDLKALLANEPGYERGDVISQDDGLMVGFVSVWSSRADVLRFHDGGFNQLLMASIKLKIAGTAVIRLFRIIR